MLMEGVAEEAGKGVPRSWYLALVSPQKKYNDTYPHVLHVQQKDSVLV